MFKRLLCLFTLFLISGSLAFGTTFSPQDHLDVSSVSAQIKLSRAQAILATLVTNPQDYQLILSSNTSIGAEAVPPHVYSDKPTMIVYQGTLSPDRSKEEIAMVMAHELGHLNLHHSNQMGSIMDKIMGGTPLEMSGTTFFPYFQKFQEQQADLYGLNLYKEAGYDLNFFSYTLKLIEINPNIHFGSTHVFHQSHSSLSLKDSHFGIKERFQLLTALAKYS
jgi:Zn-dependent protease with chaperone function